MQSWWYYAGGAIVFTAVFAGPWACAKLEDWLDKRDREAWGRMPGGML